MKRHSVIVWILAIASAVGVEAAVSKLNSELMDRDLRIMEGILKDLLGAEESAPVIPGGSGPQVQGTYYDGYGVLFNVEGSRAQRQVRVKVSRRLGEEEVVEVEDSQPVRVVVKRGPQSGGAPHRSGSPQGGEAPDLGKERIIEFMNAYAGAIRQLKPTDRITVRLDARPRVHAYVHAGHGRHGEEALLHLSELKNLGELPDMKGLGETIHAQLKDAHVEIEAAARELAKTAGDVSRAVLADYSAEGGGKSLVATVLKKDLDAHRGSDALVKKITFEEGGEANSAIGRDVHIFQGILQSSLGQERFSYGRGARPTGFYQKGIGAVFFLEHQMGSGFAWAGGDFEWMSHQSHAGGDTQTDDAKNSVNELAGQISEALADYGATLKRVANDEEIIVNVRLRGRKAPDAPSRLVVKVRKDAVSRYSQGKLSLEKFMKEVKRSEL